MTKRVYVIASFNTTEILNPYGLSSHSIKMRHAIKSKTISARKNRTNTANMPNTVALYHVKISAMRLV